MVWVHNEKSSGEKKKVFFFPDDFGLRSGVIQKTASAKKRYTLYTSIVSYVLVRILRSISWPLG